MGLSYRKINLIAIHAIAMSSEGISQYWGLVVTAHALQDAGAALRSQMHIYCL